MELWTKGFNVEKTENDLNEFNKVINNLENSNIVIKNEDVDYKMV